MNNDQSGNHVDRYIGTRLRQARLSAGMSQTDLGNRINLSYQQVQKYEVGKNRISGGRMWELAAVLGVSVTYFFNGLENFVTKPTDESTDFDQILSSKEYRIIHQLRRLDPIAQDAIIGLISTMHNKAVGRSGELGSNVEFVDFQCNRSLGQE